MNKTEKAHAAILAKAITAICVRNGYLEDLHSGITPSSKAGDYSDVKVVTPYGEIPWEKLSRISDEEMKRLMKGIVNQIYTFLCRQADPAFLNWFISMGCNYSALWDKPELEEETFVREKATKKKRKRTNSGE
jgi:hypothetical protein